MKKGGSVIELLFWAVLIIAALFVVSLCLYEYYR